MLKHDGLEHKIHVFPPPLPPLRSLCTCGYSFFCSHSTHQKNLFWKVRLLFSLGFFSVFQCRRKKTKDAGAAWKTMGGNDGVYTVTRLISAPSSATPDFLTDGCTQTRVPCAHRLLRSLDDDFCRQEQKRRLLIGGVSTECRAGFIGSYVAGVIREIGIATRRKQIDLYVKKNWWFGIPFFFSVCARSIHRIQVVEEEEKADGS